MVDATVYHTPACDKHEGRVLSFRGPEGLDDVCPICRIESLTAEVEQKNSELAAWAGWYVLWEEQIPKNARDRIEARLASVAEGQKVAIIGKPKAGVMAAAAADIRSENE